MCSLCYIWRVMLVCLDRTDSALCRSQSSSLSSLDGPVSKEAVQYLCFAETYARKSGMVELNQKSYLLSELPHAGCVSGGGAWNILGVRKRGLGWGECGMGWPLPPCGCGVTSPENIWSKFCIFVYLRKCALQRWTGTSARHHRNIAGVRDIALTPQL